MPYTEQRITSVRRWSGKTFSFTTTRPDDFQFDNGEFVTLGLKPENKLIARAYSIVSMRNAKHLEFLSIHVPGGPLTSHLARIGKGDSVWINSKTTGSLTLKHVQPGRNLYLLSTGTGLALPCSVVTESIVEQNSAWVTEIRYDHFANVSDLDSLPLVVY